MTAFFIDADNLCAASWVDEAFRTLEQMEGAVSVRRAYGSAEKLKGLGDVLRTRLIRPYLNLSLSKNTTDVALAVDVMELSHATPRPAVIAIGSGDADFVPLVLRLRERGFRVVCVSEKGKMAPEAVDAYDQVFFVGQESATVIEAPAPRSEPVHKTPVRKAAAKKAAPAKTPAASPPAKKAVAKKPAAPAKKVATPAAAKRVAVAADQVTVRQILEHAPSLKSGQRQPLGEIVKLLHDAKLLGKNAMSTKLFKKFPDHFELLPAKQPNGVRYLLTSP